MRHLKIAKITEIDAMTITATSAARAEDVKLGILMGFTGSLVFFFFTDAATTEIYTLSLHDALPILAHLVVERAHDLLDRGRLVPHVQPQQVDAVGAEPAQARLQRADQALAVVAP